MIKITIEEFTAAFKSVLLKKPPKKSLYENRKPTQKELAMRWRLERRKGK